MKPKYVMISLLALFIILYAFLMKNFSVTGFHKESFQTETNKQIFTTNISNMNSIIDMNIEALNYELMSMMINVLENGKEIPNNWQGTTLCIDPLNLTRVQKGNLGTYRKLDTEGYFVRIVNPERRYDMKCPYDIANRKIGVFDICDYHLVKSIANGYRLPFTEFDYMVDYIPVNQWNNLENLLVNDYDVVYAYIVPKSRFQEMIYSQRVYITGFDTMDISRINAFYPSTAMRRTYMDDVYKLDPLKTPNAIYDRIDPVNLLWMPHYLFTIGNPKTPPSLTETFISRLSISDEISDPAYRCYGDIKNENRALCNSTYDPWGNPKKDQTYWDTPCIDDKDCPFYKANRNYPNEFGKCMSNGICEFPVGVRRLAYIKYNDNFPYTPMCYGCEPSILDCCTDQKNNPEKYPQFISPDYVFPNDTTLREPRNLETIIPML